MDDDEFDPPFFHWSDDLLSFDSVESMCAFIEPWDVQEGDLAFDACGRRVVLRSVGVRRSWGSVGGGSTELDVGASGALAADEFADVLRDYLRRADPTGSQLPAVDLDLASLGELVSAVHPLTSTR